MSALEILEEACAALPHTKRAMFGGHAFFAPNGGVFAAVIDEDRVMLKFVIDTPGHAAFTAAGGEPWEYRGKPRPMVMKEWLVVPEDLHDEPRALAEWAAKAHRLAPAKKGKPAKKAARPTKKAAKKSTRRR